MNGVAPPGPAPAAGCAAIRAADLARLMPMYLLLDAAARIVAAGPTLQRLFPAGELVGSALFDLFEVGGPGRISDAATMAAHAGRRLRLALRRGHDRGGPCRHAARHDGRDREGRDREGRGELPRLRMRGLAVVLDGGGFLVNLAFGVDIVPAVALLRLEGADFAPTDSAIELLYLAEANAAVMAEMRRLLERLERARLQAEDEARTDSLTGLGNRRALDSLLARLCRERAAFALLSIDLDGFKKVNDTLGHATGDRVLVEVARRLRAETAARDFIARVGGDEFAVLLPGSAGAGRLRFIGNAILAALSRPIATRGGDCIVTASIGIATSAEGADSDPAAILALADEGVYAAKGAGRGRVEMAGAPAARPRAGSPPGRTVPGLPPARRPSGRSAPP